jgi:prepilin-type processing-associated H-X9-DG protein
MSDRPIVMASPPVPPAEQKRSKLALWSLILSIFFFIPPLGIIGLILGIVALVNISKSGGALGGKGLAIAGTVIGGVTTFMMCMMVPMAAVLFPALSKAREQARAVMCRNDLMQVGLAIGMYEVDNGGAMPPNLQALVNGGYIKGVVILRCPAAARTAALNPSDVDATGDYYYARIATPESLVQPGSVPIVWDKEMVHDMTGVNVLFADLHVQFMEIGNLIAAIQRNSSLYETPPQVPQPSPSN